MPSLTVTEDDFKKIIEASVANPASNLAQIKGFASASATTDLEMRIKEQAIVRLGEIYKLTKYYKITNEDPLMTSHSF